MSGKPDTVETLVQSTANSLAEARGHREQLKSGLFLYLHRAYELGLDPDEVVDVLGVKQPNIMDLAGLDEHDVHFLLEQYETLDPVIAPVYGH